ncbi:hypothetical protein D3C84_432880 [compost metagenome]
MPLKKDRQNPLSLLLILMALTIYGLMLFMAGTIMWLELREMRRINPGLPQARIRMLIIHYHGLLERDQVVLKKMTSLMRWRI